MPLLLHFWHIQHTNIQCNNSSQAAVEDAKGALALLEHPDEFPSAEAIMPRNDNTNNMNNDNTTNYNTHTDDNTNTEYNNDSNSY